MIFGFQFVLQDAEAFFLINLPQYLLAQNFQFAISFVRKSKRF